MLLSRIVTLLFLVFITPLAFSATNERKLIVSYGAHNAAPFAIEIAEKLQGGIIKDIVEEISTELDIDITFFKTPRKRIERYLESNTIHLVLISNPAWLSNSDKLQWSEPLFIERDIIVVPSNAQQTYRSFDDMKNMTIGTIRGYSYPTLQPYFNSQFFTRYDVNSLDVNFIRLSLNRLDAFVDSEILIQYHLTKLENANDFTVLPFAASEHTISAVLSPNAPITLTQLNTVLKKLKSQGVISAILEKYQVRKHKQPQVIVTTATTTN